MPRSREALTAAYAEGVHRIRERTLLVARTLWESSPALRDDDVARLRRMIIPRVQGAQLQVANLANAYVVGLARLDAVEAAPTRVDRDAILGYRGTPVTDVYTRPAVETYTSLSNGNDFEQAKASGLNRLLSIVATDVQQARNRQSAAAYQNTAYEFTIRTLTGRENCALCVIASTQRYYKRDRRLLPIHPGCDCGQRGVKSARDPGQVIDPRLLELTHDAVAAKTGGSDRGARVITGENPVSDYLDLIVTNEHGELGPTLAWRADRFTGPSDIPMVLS